MEQHARQLERTSLPYSVVLVPPELCFLGEQRLAYVQPGPSAGVTNVLVDRQRALDESLQLVGVYAQVSPLAAGHRDIEQTQEVVYRLA